MLPSAPSARGRRGGRAGAGETRLLDFGIAKVMEGDDGATSGQTQTSSTLPAYSPKYASPEQVSRMKTGPWTDVHAVALVLTEVLVDEAPYDSGDKLRLTAQTMAATRPTPARFGVDVGPWEPVLARALALHPSERYADAGELLGALEAAVAGAQRARLAMSPMLVDEPTVTRALPLATPPAVAPVGAGTISAVVSQAPPPRPPRVNGARASRRSPPRPRLWASRRTRSSGPARRASSPPRRGSSPRRRPSPRPRWRRPSRRPRRSSTRRSRSPTRPPPWSRPHPRRPCDRPPPAATSGGRGRRGPSPRRRGRDRPSTSVRRWSKPTVRHTTLVAALALLLTPAWAGRRRRRRAGSSWCGRRPRAGRVSTPRRSRSGRPRGACR